MPRLGAPPAAVAAALLALAVAPSPVAAVEARYAWNLATPAGPLKTTGVLLSYDAKGRELFVLDGGTVRIFGESGMETFSFGTEAAVGGVRDVTVLDGGDLLVLTRAAELSLVRCNFRGEPVARLSPRLPSELEGFTPAFVRARGDRIYLADAREMQVVVLDLGGGFVRSYDVAKLLGVEDKRAENGIRGFGVDYEGNLLVTVQPLFLAATITKDGEVRAFGKKGSGPGKFGVVAGIAADERGYLYVADQLRCVVLVFDPALRFVREFGYRGKAPGNLVVPSDVAAGNGKVFVSQYAGRGVSVYDVEGEAPPAELAAAPSVKQP